MLIPLLSIYRHPRVLIGLLALSTLLIIGTSQHSKAAESAPYCISYITNTQTVFIDPLSGTITRVPRTSPIEFAIPAPDNQHVAILRPNLANGQKRSTLLIKTIHEGVETDEVRAATDLPFVDLQFHDRGGISVLWSPNSQWLAYYWADETGGHIAVANAVTKRTKTRDSLDLGQPQFNGWAADSSQFATISRIADDSQLSHEYALTVWSVPDLEVVNPNLQQPMIEDTCRFGIAGELACLAYWSPTGHQIAYAIRSNNPQLVIGDGKRFRVVSMPAIPADILWSPDSKHIAIRTAQRLYVLSNQTTLSAIVSGVIASAHTGEGPYDPVMNWSPDGNQLFFLQSRSNGRDMMWSFDPKLNRRRIIGEVWNIGQQTYSIRTAFAFTRNYRYVLLQSNPNVSPEMFSDYDLPVTISLVDTQTLKKSVLVENQTVRVFRWTPDEKFGFAVWLHGIAWISPDGLKPQMIQVPDDNQIWLEQLSNNGQWMAYTVKRQGQISLQLVDLLTGRIQIMRPFSSQSAAAFFSPDSQHIAVLGDDQLILVATTGSWSHETGLDRNHKLDPAFSSNQQNFVVNTPWLPDGSLLAFTHQNDNSKTLELFKVDGTHLHSITNLPNTALLYTTRNCSLEI